MAALDWLQVLELDRAIANCRTDIFGDWHRDPWDWPELDWLGTDSGATHVIERLNGRGVHRSRPIAIAKENFLTRPAVVLDPVDRLIYQALVDRSSIKLIGDLEPWVFSFRLSRIDPQSCHYRDNGSEWSSYRNSMSRLSDHFEAGIATDVVSFFESIPIDQLCDQLGAALGNSPVTERLQDLVTSWGSNVTNRKGLPQRAWGSSVLAHFYLRPLDDILKSNATTFKRFTSRGITDHYGLTRWVDDIWVFSNEEHRLRRAQLAIQDVLRDLGLHLHAGKTKALEGEDLVRAAKDLQRSAIDGELRSDPPSTERLNELIDEVLEDPVTASHTLVRLATVRMREFGLYDRVGEFVEQAHRMPHCAQHLARLFRDSGEWRELQDWFVEHVSGPWARVSWSVAQLGTMFPSNAAQDLSQGVLDLFSETLAGQRQLSGGPSLSLTALLSQRLASWRPESCRAILRTIVADSADPMDRRIFAFAGLNAGENAQWVRNVLNEFEENRITSEFLDDHNFVDVAPGGDFQGF